MSTHVQLIVVFLVGLIQIEIKLAENTTMEVFAEQLANMAQKIKEKIASQVPDVPIEEIDVRAWGATHVSGRIVILNITLDFPSSGAQIYWKGVGFDEIIDADYDMFRDEFFEQSEIYLNETPEDHVRILSGVQRRKDQEEIAKLREENAKLREENAELRYKPGGPGYLAAKEHFDDLKGVN